MQITNVRWMNNYNYSHVKLSDGRVLTNVNEELLHRLIDKIEVKENTEVIIHYRFSNPFSA